MFNITGDEQIVSYRYRNKRMTILGRVVFFFFCQKYPQGTMRPQKSHMREQLDTKLVEQKTTRFVHSSGFGVVYFLSK